jgi:hypothetical protein
MPRGVPHASLPGWGCRGCTLPERVALLLAAGVAVVVGMVARADLLDRVAVGVGGPARGARVVELKEQVRLVLQAQVELAVDGLDGLHSSSQATPRIKARPAHGMQGLLLSHRPLC